jgi:hypothetical protein
MIPAVGVNEDLDGNDVLPGFSLRIGEIFAQLPEEEN